MAAELEDLLRSLHRLLDGHQSSKREQIEVTVEDIKRICEHEITDKDLDNVCSQLFDENYGITRFLQRTADSEEMQNGKATALSLLSEILQKIGEKALQYVVNIKEACISVYSKDRFAKVKNAVFPVLIKLLELTARRSLGEDLKIDKMIQKFFTELTKASKLAATVKAGIYHLLGVIAEVYPDLMSPYSERLVNLYVSALKAEMTGKTKKPELTIIAGCLEGLTAYLVNFTQSAEEGSKYSHDIFTYARKAIESSTNFTRYDVPKAGLKLFTCHASQFRQHLMDEHESMYKKLKFWSHHNNKDVLHQGVAAMEAFIKEISDDLVEKAKQGVKPGSIFKFFLLEFRSIMNDKQSTSKEISLAIRSYGLLAAPCRSFLSEADTQFMFSEMISKCEHQFFGQVEDIEERLISIPSYLMALANIIRQLDSVSASHSIVLERLIVLLIENIPQVNERLQYPCFKSVLMLLLTLMGKATVFQHVLSSVVYQGLIRTCSHPIVATAQLDEPESDIRIKKVSYKDFIPLWSNLLGSAQMKDLAAEDFSIADRKQLTEVLYNELIAAILKVLNKLDFEAVSTNDASEDSAEDEIMECLSADPTFGVAAKKPKDFQVFINIVDFCKDLLINNHRELFVSWVFTFTHTLIVLSTRHPLVSGFYKLLSVTMTVANKLNYFKECSRDQPLLSVADESIEVDEDSFSAGTKEKNSAYQLIKKFSKEVLVRMKQYRDDLLASCLTLILSLPKEVIVDQMTDIIPAIQKTFTIGLSYLPLASIGLDALEYWCHSLPPYVLEPYYAEFLPCLDAYLRTDDRGAEEVAANQAVVIKPKKSSGRVQTSVRLVRNKKLIDDKGSGSQLSIIKRRILRYLGSLGGQVNYALLSHTEEEVSQEAIAWDTEKHLRFDVPFFDMKPAIYFDPFLPQVVKLAQQSSDRQTKVAACELLHALVLYALGRGAQMPGEAQKRHPMEQLYRKLFPSLLHLACDVEQICKDLFEPLVMQLIHWFTGNKTAESPETMALLDTIFDGLIQADDTALRDFSARCLKEFLQWSLKQISKKAAEKNPINVKSVLRRIYSYACHPNAFKRLGAALAFNNIYKVFREEEALIDRFTFEILVYFVESLSLAHNDGKSLGTQEQCVQVLRNLERIIIKKADILKKDPGPKIRPEPNFWSSRKLEFAVRWLTRRCGNPQTECRHTCMKLVFKLCTLLPGVKSPKDFFTIIYKDQGAKYFLNRFEGGGSVTDNSHGLLAYPTMDKIREPFSISSAQQWFDLLLAALDCYCWVFGERLLTPAQLFTGEGSKLSRIFESIVFFLETLSLTDIDTAAHLFPQREAAVFTPMERDEYNRMKCTAIIRVWNFLSVLTNHTEEVQKVVPSHVWCENLWKLLCCTVVSPSSIGFNMADTEIMVNLPKEMNQILAMLTKCLPAPQMKQFKLCLTEYLSKDCNLISLLPINLSSGVSDYTQLSQIVEGYRQLNSAKLLSDHLPQTGAKEKGGLALKLFSNVFEGVVKTEGTTMTSISLSPTAQNLAKSLLMLSLELGLSSDILIVKLLDKTSVQGLSQGTKAARSNLFLSTFSSTIASHIAQSGHGLIETVMNKAKADQECVSSVLIAVLDHVSKDRSLRKKEGASLCGKILNQWTKLSSWWGDEATTETQSLALQVLTKIMLIDSKNATSPSSKAFTPVFGMYLSMLKDSRTTMAFKNQALDLLPFFASVKENNKELKNTLNRFIADNFPLTSSEFSEGTYKHKDYITAINKLLVALEMTGSLMLLEIVISVLCREERHTHENAIQSSIANFVKRLPLDQQRPALDVPYAIFVQEEGFPPEIRRATIERVCLSMLRLASPGAIIEFFMDHIQELIDKMETKLHMSTESVLKNQLVTKICCFQLLELMYARLDKDAVNSKSSAINQKFCCGKVETGKEMTQRITKAAQEAKSEDTRGEMLLSDLRRQYHCYAYNLMIAIISCVQTDIKFYKGFLFQDNVAKGQFLLDNIIDKDIKYEFPVDLQAPLERRKKFVAIRSEAREKRGEKSGSSGSWDTSFTSSLHLASQYLADSSLSDDLNQYDFNLSSSETGSYSSGTKKHTNHTGTEESSLAESSITENYIELEMDALNQHECMASLIALIKYMTDSNISPEVPKGTIPKEMPSWMSYLHEKITSSQSPVNLKFFIAKLVMNCSQIFQPFAKFWIRPLCQLFFAQEVSGSGITYFAVDLIITMVSWHETAIPQDTAEERAMASRVVKMLMDKIYHPVRPVFRNNLEILKTLLECWRDRVEIPYDIIYSLMKTTEPSSDKYAAGIQVLGVVVAAKFEPYGPSAPVDQERYMGLLAGMMNHHLKKIYAAAAEVIGFIFHHRADTQKDAEGGFYNTVITQLTGLSNTKADNFITCLHRIHRNYPPLTERFLNKLLFILPIVHGQFRTQCLEVILGHVDKLENVFVELNSKGLPQFLTNRDEDTQVVSLKIVKSMMSKLKASELRSLLPLVSAFSSGQSSQVCRMIMLEILMWAYDNYREEEDEDSQEIIRLTKEALLKGLCDEDLACRCVCQTFWRSNTRLPEGTLDRTMSMLEAMYSPNTEPYYLAYATNLLMEATSRSPDYMREIFEHPLSECQFQDYSVHSSWRQRHAVMTPLFASTLVSQAVDADDLEDGLEGGVRATQQTADFTPTMDLAGSSKAFNWLTQSSLDTFTEARTVGSDSQLLFNQDRGQNLNRSGNRGQMWTNASHLPKASKTMTLKSRSAEESKPSTSKESAAESHSDVWRLKQRYIRDQHSQSVFYMKQNIRLNKMREEVLKEQKARRENQVTLYRKYRTGDLPDIQIKYQSIIAPLQALANRDSTVAKILFSSLFQAIFTEMDKVKTEREAENLIQAINKSLKEILFQSTRYFPPFIGCILDILYELRSSLKVPATHLGISALNSNQQILGIMVLEEQLIQSDSSHTATSSKRARHNREEESADASQWIELSNLYKSVHEFDVLQGIFGDKLGTKEITREAIQDEARGDYNTAFKKYREALCKDNWSDGEPLEEEVMFWEDNQMECLDNLCQWKDLEKISVECAEGLDHVWDDDYNQEHYLPYIIRSKLKLMLSEDPSQQSLLTFIDESSTKDEQKKQHLESRYCTELALMYLWQKNYDRSRVYTQVAIDSFLQDWCNTTTLLQPCQKDNLRKVQALVELQEFLDHVGPHKNLPVVELPKLMKQWDGRSPHCLLDPVTIWDDVVTNRTAYLELFKTQLQGQEEDEETESYASRSQRTVERVEAMQVWLRLTMADSCQRQNNFTLALRLLKDVKDTEALQRDQNLTVEWVHLYAKTHHGKAESSPVPWKSNVFHNVCTTLDQLDKMQDIPVLRERPDLGLRHYILKGRGLKTCAEGLLAIEHIPDLNKEIMSKLSKHAELNTSNKNELINGFLLRSFISFKAAVGQDFEDGASKKKIVMTKGEANLELAKFCDKYLRMKEDDELPATCDVSEYPLTVVVCLLKAMQEGIDEARERFPRLLQVADLYPEVNGTFIKKSAEIPCWMFILWVSQMTALLDKKEAAVVAPLLIRIADEYPQALIYPLRMSYESFQFESSSESKKKKETVEILRQKTDNVMVNKFISALEQFGQPDMIFKDWCSEIRRLLDKKNKEEILKKFKEIYNDLFNVKAQGDGDTADTLTSISSTAATVGMGEYRRAFASAFKAEFEKLFEPDGKKLIAMNQKEFYAAEAKLTGLFQTTKNKINAPVKLKDYCSWLAEFNPNRYGRDLEIPGQYDGLKKPLPEYHVKVAGFDERVVVMTSLRKPKRITVRGNDEKEYPFLVKCGEDLRLDQRIETLFFVMNKVMAADSACQQRKLHLKTYKVISMTPRVGLIEWMRNTQPLKTFLYDALTEEERKYIESDQGPSKQHFNWVSKLVEKNNQFKHQIVYDRVYIKYSLSETVREFRQKEGKVPWDLSRRALKKMSASPEAFHVLRTAMITSHAVICICQYLLGIGDRHLSNFMVNLKTGHMVGIDFGHAFGSATQFLPVPELIPFRLTRQLVNLNMPMQVKGQMESTMRHVLRALRNDSDLLLSMMDVFVKEPSLDWLNFAEKQKEDLKMTKEESTDRSWYPKQKIQFARRKLKGDNPSYVMKEELCLGHEKREAYKSMILVLLGHKGDNVRAQLPAHHLTVEQQVAALIDHATDPNILGRTWLGWEPWV